MSLRWDRRVQRLVGRRKDVSAPYARSPVTCKPRPGGHNILVVMCVRRVVLVLLLCGCGSSPNSRDSASPRDSPSFDLTLVSTIDADLCSRALGWNLPTDAASCVSAQGNGVVYDLSRGVDAGGCASRPTVPCSGVCGAGPTLYTQIMERIGRCLTGESTFIVTFSEGCADHLYLETHYYDPDSMVACVSDALGTAHFLCAEQVPCWQWSESTILPFAP
jgi:hypothetical protein